MAGKTRKRAAAPKQRRDHRLAGELTVYTVGRHLPALLDFIGRARVATGLDLSQVTEIDTAGLQLLLVARSAAAARGQTLRLVEPSAPVCEALALCRLYDAFDRAPDPASGTKAADGVNRGAA